MAIWHQYPPFPDTRNLYPLFTTPHDDPRILVPQFLSNDVPKESPKKNPEIGALQ